MAVIMKTLIKLTIERFEEGEKEYYVATSDEVQGLVAEGETIEETVEIAEDLVRMLLEIDSEKSHSNYHPKHLPNQFEYPLILEV